MAKKAAEPIANLIAEKSLLGAIMNSSHQFWAVADLLRPEYFFDATHQQIYSVMRDVMEVSRNLSMAVLLSRLPEEDAEGRSFEAILGALQHNAAELNATDFATDIAETSSRRRAIVIGEKLVRAAKAGNKFAVDIASEAEIALLDVMHVNSPRRPKRLSDIIDTVLHSAERARQTDALPGITTGLQSLDEILGLVLAGDLGFAIGAQGDGKSSMAAQWGVHVAKTRPVLMFQFEMGDEQVAARELAAVSGVPVRAINEGNLDQWQWQSLKEAEQALAKPEFWILDAPQLTIRQMRSHCLAMKRSQGLGMVIVDQLDKVKSEGHHRDRFERSTEVTAGLKVLAKDLGCPVLVLAQRTRTAQRRDDPTPQILDADAPSIERDADWVIGIWRRYNWLRSNRPHHGGGEDMEKWENELARCKDTAEMIILKQRRCSTYEQRTFKWVGNLTRFEEM